MKSPVILRVFRNNQLVEVKQFTQPQIVLGREGDISLKLEDEHVSTIHCLIELRESGYFICDLGSSTGTFKNGQAILDEKIDSGDEIQVGPFKLVFFVGVPKPISVPSSSSNILADTPVIPAVKPTTLSEPKSEIKKEIKSSIPNRPELKSKKEISFSRSKKGHKTFAPVSGFSSVKDIVGPGKGAVLEIIVAWQERVISTHHFRAKQSVRVGASSQDQIQIPRGILSTSHRIADTSAGVQVFVAPEMQVEIVQSQAILSAAELQSSGRINSGVIRLEQNESIHLRLGESGLSLVVRYAPQTAIAPLLPSFGLSGSEVASLVMSIVLVSVLAFYISATTPKDLYDKEQEELTRVAQVIFTKPPQVIKPPEQKPPEPPPPPPQQVKTPPPPPEKAKVSDEKKELQKKGQPAEKSLKNQVAGRASEVAPIPNSQNRPKKFTSTKQGGAVKLGQTPGAGASGGKDVSKIGLFSAFGGGGIRNKLDTAYSGAGEILGQADKATGTSGMNENRAGDDLGSRFKDTGAGGKGTATQGIAGIGTKGRGSGQSAYGDANGFGEKTSVAIEPGGAEESFVGTIDREAVRRRVKHYLHEIRGCFVRELNRLAKGQKLEGKVVVMWDIVEKGIPKNVQIKSTTLNNASVEGCIRERLASWNFPEPPVGMTATVSYPFYFRPEN